MTETPVRPHSPDDAWLIVRRSDEHADLFRKYDVRVDGEVVGKVGRGAQLMVRLPHGTHTVDATIDWCGSQQVTITCAPGSRTTLHVAGQQKGLRAFFLLVYAIFGHRDYLVLEAEDPDELPPQRPRTMVVRPPAKS